jgi:hypothetical protein
MNSVDCFQKAAGLPIVIIRHHRTSKLQHLSAIQVRCTPPSMLSIAFMRGDDPGISGRLSVSVAMPSAIPQRTGLDMDAPEISFGCASASEECRGRTNEKGSITSEIYSAESATRTTSDLKCGHRAAKKFVLTVLASRHLQAGLRRGI